MIAWKYIDKGNATVAAIRDYKSMRVILTNTPQEIKETYMKITAPRTSNFSGMPSARNPQGSADKLADSLDKLDILRERYSQAIEYMDWVEPAWCSLTDSEQLVLREFYMGDNQKSGATYRLMQSLKFSERQVERMRGKALKHFQIILFG